MSQIPVLKPGFEEATFGPEWGGNTDGGDTRGADSTVVHSGAWSAKTVQVNAGADTYWSQIQANNPALVSVPGVTYLLKAWVNCTVFTAPAASNRGLALVVDGSLVTAPITATTAGWVQLSVQSTAATATGIQIRLYFPQGTIYWDDVELWDSTLSGIIVPAVPFSYR